MSSTVPGEAALVELPVVIAADDQVALDSLGEARRKRAMEVAAGVSATDSTCLAVFGAAPQRKLSGFLDQLLAGTGTNEIGVAGDLVTELATSLKRLDLPGMKREAEGAGAVLSRVPVLGRYFSALRRFRAMRQGVLTHLTEIERKAEVHLGKLKATNAGLDRLVDATEDNLREIEVYIAGGQQAALRMRAEHAALREQVRNSRDAVQMAKLRDMSEQINAFETRLVRMQVAFTRGILAIPQIRTAQQAGRIEIQNTLDTVLFDLPDFKSALVRVAALERIGRASDATAARRKITRELQEIGIDALDSAYTKAKASQGDMADDVASLAQVSDRMIGIINRGLEMDRANRGKRDEAVRQIGDVRAKLLDSLRDHADRALQP
jgi:uncharacterized protein YaaN involved in tellurite resistance